MEPAPLVSVCISAYNVETFVAQALRSVLAQSYRNIEFIVIDNGSQDGTAAILKTFSDPRLTLYFEPVNLGGYQAMNKAAAMARGEFIAIFHSDDVYEPTIVEKEVRHLCGHAEVGAVFCLDHMIDEEGRLIGSVQLPDEFRDRAALDYDLVFRYMMRRKVPFCCPTFMVRRGVWKEIGPFDPDTWGIGSDLDMWVRILRRHPLAILPEQLIRYRKGRQQWSARYRNLRTTEDVFFAVMDHYIRVDDWQRRASECERVEYEFHRCDDRTMRARNHWVQGGTESARQLLMQRFPWRTLGFGVRRRKLRLVALRAIMFVGLSVRAYRPLARVLQHMGP